MYHPHLRPLTTPIATLLSGASNVQRLLKSPDSPLSAFPTPSQVLHALGRSTPGSPFASMANALEIPPMHVDQVAQAIVLAIERPKEIVTNEVIGVREMRELIGWEWEAKVKAEANVAS